MNVFRLIAFLAMVLFFNFQEGQAQDNISNTSNTLFLGFPANFFDVPDLGIYVGYNLEYIKRERFSWEGQVSFSYSSYERDFDNFAHDGGQTLVGSLLVGPRFYLIKPKRNISLYLNCLPGVALVADEEYKPANGGWVFIQRTVDLALGYSIGSYLQFKNKFIAGVAIEQSASIVFKLGYKL